MDDLVRNVYDLVREDENYGEKFFITLGIIIIVILLNKLVRHVSKKMTKNEKKRYWIREISSYVFVFLAICAVFYTWFNALEGLMAAFSVILGLTVIALRDLFMNAAGFFYIKTKRPFSVGDRIEIDGYTGDVVDVDFLQFSIAEVGNWLHSTNHTGRVVFIANKEVFDKSLANFTKNFPYIWKDLQVTISYESNEKKLMEIMKNIGTDILKEIVEEDQKDPKQNKYLEKLGRRIQLFDGSVLPKVHVAVDLNGINVILRYIVPYRKGTFYETKIWERLLDEIKKENDIELTVNTFKIVR